MTFIKKEHKGFNKDSYGYFILCGDIGGTNTALGIFGVKSSFAELLISFHFKSAELKGLHEAVNEALIEAKNNGIKITKACFALPGVLSSGRKSAKITNIKWNVSEKELLNKTMLKSIILLNDFEAIGYWINIKNRRSMIKIKKGNKIPKAAIIVIGAGTGLGKTALIYDSQNKMHRPHPSEAGHSDFPVESRLEFELLEFIKKRKKLMHVSYEDVLSGHGLTNIYLFLRKMKRFKETRYTEEIDKCKGLPETISKYRKADKTCRAVFEIFKSFYARFARNSAIDALAYGGVYIAGGIAQKNSSIFDAKFVKSFEDNPKFRSTLRKIPIYLISENKVGLLGAGFAGAKLFKELKKNF